MINHELKWVSLKIMSHFIQYQLEMPKLHCFTMDLAKKPPDPEEVRHLFGHLKNIGMHNTVCQSLAHNI